MWFVFLTPYFAQKCEHSIYEIKHTIWIRQPKGREIERSSRAARQPMNETASFVENLERRRRDMS